MPKILPGGFILEDDETTGQPTATATAPAQDFVLEPAAPDPWAGRRPPMEPSAPPASPDRPLVLDLLRAPYAFGRNAITALPGLAGDLGSLVDLGLDKWLQGGPGLGSPERPGTKPREGGFGILPTQESLNKRINAATGVTGEPSPGWAGAPERIAGVIGSSYGPGKFTRELEGALKLTETTGGVWGAIKNSLTAGSTGDIVIGAGSGISEEAVRQFVSDNPWLTGIGGALGSFATAVLHGGVTRAAAPFQREQAVVAGEKGLHDVERLGEGITDSAARTVQSEQDRLAQEVAAARAANKGAVAPLQADARAKQGLMTTAAEDIDMAKAAAAKREATALAQGEQWKTAARLADERETSRLAQQGTPPGAYEQLQPTLDLTSPPQGTKGTGEAIRTDVAASGEATAQAQAQARMPEYQTATTGMGKQLPPQGVIDITKADFQPQFAREKMRHGKNLDEIETIINKEARAVGGVKLDNIRNQLDSFVTEAMKTPGATVSREILEWAEMGLSPAQKRGLQGEGLVRAKNALQLNAESHVPFTALRKIDRELGASGRAGLVGTMPQGEARAMKEALNRDFDVFFESDAGSMLGPEFAKRKEAYKDFRTNFDKSILGKLLDERAGDQAQGFLDFLHKGDAKSNKQLQFILDNAGPETKDAIRGHMVAKMAQNSLDGAGNLNPAALDTQLKALRKNGTFELYFDDPAQRQTLVETVQKLSAADTSIETMFRDKVNATLPEDVPGMVFKPGNISYTEKFQTISTPQQYQDAVGAWAADVKARLPDMTPDQIHKEFAPMAVKHDGVSQLDLMFGHIPGAADKISDMVTQHRTPPPKPGAPRLTLPGTEETAAVHLQNVQAQNAKELGEAKRLHDLAKQEYADAQQLAKDTRAAGSQVTAETRERLTQDVREAQRKQREAQAVVDKATQDAKDKLLEAKRDVEYKPSGAKRPQGGHEGMHRAVQVGALTGLLSAAMSHSPWVAATAGAILVHEGVRGTKNALFRSQRGQDFLRTYIPNKYGAKAAMFAAQALGQGASGADEVDTGAIADTLSGAAESLMPTGP